MIRPGYNCETELVKVQPRPPFENMSNVIPIPEPAQRAQALRDAAIFFNKEIRVDIAFLIDRIKRQPAPPSAEMQKVIDYLKNARHWIGEDLSRLGTARPYPNGDDVTTTKVDPPTDVAPVNFQQWVNENIPAMKDTTP